MTNSGGGPTGPLTLTLTGANAAQFQSFGNTCFGASLAAGGSCIVQLLFAPTLSGSLSASLNVSATPGGSASSTLTGSGANCTHQNGLGQTYTDCTNALGTPGTTATYNALMAQEAATAAVQLGGDASTQITLGTCGGNSVLTRTGTLGTATWAYAGTAVGHVTLGAFCPSVANPTWN